MRNPTNGFRYAYRTDSGDLNSMGNRRMRVIFSQAGWGLLVLCFFLYLSEGGQALEFFSLEKSKCTPCPEDQAPPPPKAVSEGPQRMKGGPTIGVGSRLVDPKTGEMFPLPPTQDMSQETLRSLESSDRGLHEEPDAGGGTMVDLEGRFQPMEKSP